LVVGGWRLEVGGNAQTITAANKRTAKLLSAQVVLSARGERMVDTTQNLNA